MRRARNPVWVWIAVALLAVDFAVGGYLAWRIWNIPENHWGPDNRLLIPFFATQLVVAVLWWRALPRNVAVVFASMAALCTLASSLLISKNLLLPYELWLERGMPERWQTTTRKPDDLGD